MERRPEQIGLRVDDQCAPLSWQRGGGGALETIHAQKPARLACEGLCGVVDQDVQPREALTQRRGKSLHLSDIRGTQRHSGALRGTPGHSKALRGTRSLHLSDVGELEGTHDFKPFTPRPKVRLTGIPLCRVGGEARRRDHVRARSRTFEQRSSEDVRARNEAIRPEDDRAPDAYTAACDECNKPPKVGRLQPLCTVELGAGGA